MPNLIARLENGPLDIIGDVHGEIDALKNLLEVLGYSDEGDSSDGRKLVFLGDMIDRGPDSPAVVDIVMKLVAAGRAQCVLGNHELNVMLGRPLPGNGWFIQPNPAEQPGEFESRRVDASRVDDYLAFFADLPLILENDALRLAHACWHAPSVARIRHDMQVESQVANLYRQYELGVQKKLHEAELAHMVDEENMFYSVALDDPDWPAEVLPAHAEAEVIAQNSNPIRVLTTGPVQVASKPFYAMGRWNMADRCRWWDDYDDRLPVIIGHFWRRFDDAAERISGVFGRDVFEGIPSHAWMGKHANVYCVDYSVGQRYRERERQDGNQYHGKLAALRFPEWQVCHDDGTHLSL